MLYLSPDIFVVVLLTMPSLTTQIVLQFTLPSNTQVSYEQWLRASAHNIAKRKLTVTAWTEAKTGLTQCLVTAVNESWLEVERRRLNEQEREEQLSLCQKLSEKVASIILLVLYHSLYSVVFRCLNGTNTN